MINGKDLFLFQINLRLNQKYLLLKLSSKKLIKYLIRMNNVLINICMFRRA